jgi:hypothetical protein
MTRMKLTLTVLMLTALSVCSGRAQAQGRFDAEWLYWSRNNDSSQTYIGGPGSVDSNDDNFNYSSGYRFGLGYGLFDYDIEAIFAEVPNWNASGSSVLAAPLVFGDPTNANLPAPAPPGSFLGIRNGLTDAGLSDMANVSFLDPGATVQTRYNSSLRDFQLNLGTSRQRPVWASLGWRHLELNENSSLLTTGVFQSVDAMGGGVGGGLAGTALTDQGFTALAGGDGFAGYDPMAMAPVMTTIGALFQGTTYNDLDGGQLVIGGRVQPRDLLILEGFLKVGVYQNRARGSVTETVFAIENDDDVFQRTFTNSRRLTSFVGGVGFNFKVPVTDYIYVRAGYEALVITDVALGPDQSQGIHTNVLGDHFYRVVTGGVLLAHGGNLGLGITW